MPRARRQPVSPSLRRTACAGSARRAARRRRPAQAGRRERARRHARVPPPPPSGPRPRFRRPTVPPLHRPVGRAAACRRERRSAWPRTAGARRPPNPPAKAAGPSGWPPREHFRSGWRQSRSQVLLATAARRQQLCSLGVRAAIVKTRVGVDVCRCGIGLAWVELNVALPDVPTPFVLSAERFDDE